jgi:hypothetical protein
MREKLIEELAQVIAHSCIDLVESSCGEGECCVSCLATKLHKEGVTIQKWIPVTERMPDNNESVLVYHDDGMIRFGINKGGFADVVSTLYLKHNHHTCFSKVTHWMPLPQPPKGE